MEALLEALILKYGEPIARKLLGLEQRSQNPKYAISLGNMKIDPMRMLANQGMKGIMSGGKMSSMMGPGLLLGGALGLGYLTNPLREGSYNYNPNLQGQIDYASGRGYIGKNSGSGLAQYTDKSVLSGQNVVSGFGTNDYAKQLQNYIDKYGDKDGKGQAELEDLTTDEFDKVDAFMETLNTNNNGDGGYNEGDGGSYSGAGEDSDWGGGEKDGGFIDGTNRRYFKNGGIASL